MSLKARVQLPEDLRVFIVEDESLVLMNLESMLEELGCNVVGEAMRPDQLEECIVRGIEADVAILDVNLGTALVFDYARRIRDAGIRLVFATGYGRSGLPEEWRSYPILQKPYTTCEIAEGIAEALERT